MFCAARPASNEHRPLARDDDRDDETCAEDVVRHEDRLRERLETRPGRRDDERPRLPVGRRAREPAGIEDPLDDVVGERLAAVATLVASARDREEGVHGSSVVPAMTRASEGEPPALAPAPAAAADTAARAPRGGGGARRSGRGAAAARPVRLHRGAAPACRRADRRVGARAVPAAENEAVVRRIFDAFARKQGFALRGLFAEDATWVVPGERDHGRDVQRARGDLPLPRTAAEGDERHVRVAAGRRARDRRARGGPLSRLRRANGRTLDLDQVLLFRLEDGLVGEVLALPSDPPRSTSSGRRSLIAFRT